MITVDAVGKGPPGALAATRAAISADTDDVRVSVGDTSVALEVRRALEGEGFRVLIQDDDGRLTVIGRRGASDAPPPEPARSSPSRDAVDAPAPTAQARRQEASLSHKAAKGQTLLIMNKRMGQGVHELGEILMRSFLGAMAKADVPPAAVVLVNEGVELALFDSSTCDHLKGLEARGARILVSGTCAAHLGISDSVGVGIITSVSEIAEVVRSAERVVTI